MGRRWLLEVDGDTDAALQALSQAGLRAWVRGPAEAETAIAVPTALSLFDGSVSARAPKGTWTRQHPEGRLGELMQSAGQTRDGRTVWLASGPGDSVAWCVTGSDVGVRLGIGACPVDHVRNVGTALGTVIATAERDQE